MTFLTVQTHVTCSGNDHNSAKKETSREGREGIKIRGDAILLLDCQIYVNAKDSSMTSPYKWQNVQIVCFY